MQLFTGIPDAKGNIDWKDPQPLEKIPTMANMKDLDFYPSGYETALNNKKWNQDKAARDSLYLSFDEMGLREIDVAEDSCSVPCRTLTISEFKYVYKNKKPLLDYNMTYKEACILARAPNPAVNLQGCEPNLFKKITCSQRNMIKIITNDKIEFVNDSDDVASASVSADASAYAIAAYPNKYVKPSEVLAIWKSKFNNTILATKEFEERMQAIHDYCGHNIIQKYASQLDKPLWQIDAEIVKMGYPGFAYFAEQRVGKVDITNKHFQNLQSFYQKSVKQLQASNKKLQKQAREKESAWVKSAESENGRSSEY